MPRIRRLLASLLALAALAPLVACTVVVGGDHGVPRCDRNGDEEQREACTR